MAVASISSPEVLTPLAEVAQVDSLQEVIPLGSAFHNVRNKLELDAPKEDITLINARKKAVVKSVTESTAALSHSPLKEPLTPSPVSSEALDANTYHLHPFTRHAMSSS